MKANRKKSIIFFVIIILAFFGYIFSPIGIKIPSFLLGLGFSVIVFTNSIQLIKSGDKAFGIPFLILTTLLILFFIVVLLMGFPIVR